MTAGALNRMLVASGITAVALCGLIVPISAQPPRVDTTQGDQQHKEQQKAEKKQEQTERRRSWLLSLGTFWCSRLFARPGARFGW